jgi:predicted permease
VPPLSLYSGILVNNILPVFLVAAAGFALGRALRPDARSITRVSFYVLSPCLVFNSMAKSTLSDADFGQMAAYTVGSIVALALLTLLIGLALRLERRLLATLIVASVFVNGGNFGLAINQFAFGDEALASAVAYYAFSTLCVYTLGVLIASAGQRPWPQVIGHALLLPTTYGLVGGLLVRWSGLAVPAPLDRAISLASQATVPMMLVILGLQLAEVRAWPRTRLALVGLACLMQLIVAPALGFVIAGWLGLAGATYQAAILESAMPAAVISTILAVEYGLDSAFVTGTVLVSTVLSPITLTPLIAYLQR